MQGKSRAAKGNRVHILHLSPYYAPAYAFGGVVRAVEGLARAQARRGLRVSVLTTDAWQGSARYTGPAQETRDGVAIERLPNALPALRRFNLSTPRGLRAALHAALPQVDVLHLHEFRTLEALLAAPLAAQHKTPLLLSPHGTLTTSTGRSLLKRAWDGLLSPRVACHVQHVAALTRAEAEEAQQLWRGWGLPVPQTHLLPNGVDLDEFERLPDASAFLARWGLEGARVVLFLGRLHPRKGGEPLLRAFRQLVAPDLRLVFAGPDEGALDDLQRLAAGDARIIFTGFLDGGERLQALAAADLFALPAVGEGLSMALLEALAAGLPAIISPGCNLPEAAEAGAALLSEIDVAALHAALQSLLEDAPRRARMSAAARAFVRQHYAWDAIAAAYETLYQSLIRT